MLSPEQIKGSRELMTGCSDITLVEWSDFNKVYDQAKDYATLVEFIKNVPEFPVHPPDKGHPYKEGRAFGFNNLRNQILNFISNQEKQDE